MTLGRNKLYLFLLLACGLGYVWLYFGYTDGAHQETVGVCIVKHTTGLPCPSCGTTRSVVSLTKGDFVEALGINPMGYLVAIIMFLSPIWVVYDTLARKTTLLRFYRKIEHHVKKPKYAIPLASLVLINWAWNITKGL